MKESGLRRIGAVVVICALVGALAGIAGSAAAPSKSTATQPKKAKAQKKAAKKALRRGGLRGPGFFGGPRGLDGGPVHSEAVVPNADGTGFDTITADGGTLTSVDGSTVHIKEGTDKATYKADVAIDVGSSPTVIRNGKKATLGDLKDGDHVQVIQGTPKGTLVMAADDAWIAQREKDHMGFGRGHGHGGPPPPGGHAGPPPPGDPAAPGDPGDNQNGSQPSGSSSDGSNS